MNTEPVAAKLLGAQAAGQTLSNGKEGDLPLPGMMINDPVFVYLLAVKAVEAAGPDKRGDLPLSGTVINKKKQCQPSSKLFKHRLIPVQRGRRHKLPIVLKNLSLRSC